MFVTLSRFWPLRGRGVWMNPLKTENLRRKSFSDNVEEVLKTDVKQEIKELVTVSYNSSQRYLLKTWNAV